MPHDWLEDVFGAGGVSHEGMTRTALTQYVQGRWPDASLPSITGTIKAALDAIISANADVDNDQHHSALHFDGENFDGGQYVLAGTPGEDETTSDLDDDKVDLFHVIQDKLKDNDVAGARVALGVSSVHSNDDVCEHWAM